VLGVAKDAKDAGCDVLAFSRDLDRDTARRQAIEDGIARVPEVFAGAPAVIGGVAVPTLEGWILALLGVRNLSKITFPFRGYNIFYESTERRGTYQFV